jgi:hypothetical protein
MTRAELERAEKIASKREDDAGEALGRRAVEVAGPAPARDRGEAQASFDQRLAAWDATKRLDPEWRRLARVARWAFSEWARLDNLLRFGKV